MRGKRANGETALAAFSKLRVWERAGVRAPHKQLLVLYALGRWANGERAVRFAEAADPLKALLAEFGPPRRSYHPEYPFWYLRTGGVWDVSADGPLGFRTGKSQPTAGELTRRHAVGEFAPDVQATLTADPTLVGRIAREAARNADSPCRRPVPRRTTAGADPPRKNCDSTGAARSGVVARSDEIVVRRVRGKSAGPVPSVGAIGLPNSRCNHLPPIG